jgi:transposase
LRARVRRRRRDRAAPPGGGKLALHLEALIGWVEAEPDMTMPELAAKLLAEKGIAAHPASLSRVLIQAGFSFKKLVPAKAGKHFWPPKPTAPM